MRLGDLDALKELFDERLDSAHLQTVTRRTGKTLWAGIYTGVNWGRNTVSNAPTIDAVPVVRCKDCKWFAPNNDGLWGGCAFDTRHPDDVPKPNDYCSYGEMKDGEG